MTHRTPGPMNDRPAAARSAQNGDVVGMAVLEEDVVGNPARRAQDDGIFLRVPEPEERLRPPGIGFDQECFVEREVFGDGPW